MPFSNNKKNQSKYEINRSNHYHHHHHHHHRIKCIIHFTTNSNAYSSVCARVYVCADKIICPQFKMKMNWCVKVKHFWHVGCLKCSILQIEGQTYIKGKFLTIEKENPTKIKSHLKYICKRLIYLQSHLSLTLIYCCINFQLARIPCCCCFFTFIFSTINIMYDRSEHTMKNRHQPSLLVRNLFSVWLWYIKFSTRDVNNWIASWIFVTFFFYFVLLSFQIQFLLLLFSSNLLILHIAAVVYVCSHFMQSNIFEYAFDYVVVLYTAI